MTQKLGQLFIIGLSGPTLTQEEADFLVKNNIGGVILFDRNIESVQQLHTLCGDIQNLRHKLPDKLPFFISIDMEGGRVARLKPPFTQWPAMAKVGELGSTSVAFKLAFNMGQEMRAVGINLDFAPCIDILTNSQNTVIGDRALGKDAETVAKMSSALVRGFIKSEIICCAKHFPGHGNTLLDSHEDLPIENIDLERLNSVEIVPFKKAFRARMDMVMTAHIKFAQIDPESPVTFSKKFLRDMIREELRYRGIVISDDLDMKALTKHYDKREIPIKALQAGCDLLLYCNEATSPPLALSAVKEALSSGQIHAENLEQKYQRIVQLKKDKLAQPDPRPLAAAVKTVGHPDHLKLSKAIADGRVPVDLLNT